MLHDFPSTAQRARLYRRMTFDAQWRDYSRRCARDACEYAWSGVIGGNWGHKTISQRSSHAHKCLSGLSCCIASETFSDRMSATPAATHGAPSAKGRRKTSVLFSPHSIRSLPLWLRLNHHDFFGNCRRHRASNMSVASLSDRFTMRRGPSWARTGRGVMRC